MVPDARRRAPRHRRLPAAGAGTAARPSLVRLPYDKCGALHVHAADRAVLHRARLRLRRPGRARQVPLRGRDHALHPRGRATATTRSTGSPPSPGRTARRHVGRLLLRLHAVGGGRQRASGAQGDRPARDQRGLAGCCGWWGDSVVPLYGADYLAHYWVDHADLRLRSRTATAGRWPRCSTRASRPSAGAPPASTACSASTGPGRLRAVPAGGHPFDKLQRPGAALGGLVRQHPAVLDASTTTTLVARPDAAGLQYLVADSDRPRELPPARGARRAGRTTTTSTTRRWRACCRVYLGPGLDFFDVFLQGEGRAGERPARALAPGPRRLARRSPTWPPPGRAGAAPVPGRGGARRRGGPRAARCGRAGAGRGSGALGARPGRPRAVDARATRSPSCCDWPDEREVQGRDDVLTFTGEPMAAPLDLAGPVTAQPRRRVDLRPSMHVHVKLCDVDPDGAAQHAAARASGSSRARIRRPRRGPARATPATGCCPGHRLRLHVASSDFPLYLLAPGHGREPLVRDARAQRTSRRCSPAGRGRVVHEPDGAGAEK